MLIVCYGTLKSGYGNNRLLNTSEFVSDVTVDGYRLHYSGGTGSFPVAVKDDQSAIRAELWDISDDEDVLQRLDWLEGVPYMYTREFVSVGDKEACMYVGNPQAWKGSYQECPKDDTGKYIWNR